MKVYLVNVEEYDDYKFPEDAYNVEYVDSAWSSEYGAQTYVDRLIDECGYLPVDDEEWHSSESSSRKTVEVPNWSIGYGDKGFITFKILEMEVRENPW